MPKLPPIQLPKTDGPNFSALDPLDSRYYDPLVAQYLSEQSRIAYQAHVEAALALSLADFKICSQTTADQIVKASQKVDAKAVYREEQITKHDIKALVNCIKAAVPNSAKPYVHFGATSYDIVSTATALQTRDAISQLVLPRLRKLLLTLVDLTKKYNSTKQIGRTHGQHAVPVTFGFAIAEYVSRLGQSYEALYYSGKNLKGKFSGAVGAYNALNLFVDDPLKFEKVVLGYIGLNPAPYSTQIVPPDNTIRLVDELAITAGIMANLAHDMRHLQRTEIAEVREHFEHGQTGSSTMAHKRNPWNFENIISMHKQVLAQAMNANLNIASEHQRDLTDSASSRFYNITLASVASMCERLNRIMSKLEVDEIQMQNNLRLTKGAIAAEPLYLLLEKYGHTEAHETIKELSHRALAEQISLYEAIEADEKLYKFWSKFSINEKNIVQNPEAKYTGLAAQKARSTYQYWSKKLKDY